MKKFLRGAFGLLALGMAAPAVAADFPVAYSREPVMIPAWYDWSGFYIGVNGGWATSHNCWDQTTGPSGTFLAHEGCNTAKGGLAGGQLGYRLQASSWVFGAEFQADWTDLTGSNPSLFLPATINRTRVDYFGLLTGQIGYALDTVLLYAKGGGAVVASRYQGFASLDTSPIDGTSAIARWGATAGAGLEFAFALNWSLAVEYDHVFLGTRPEALNQGFVFIREDRIRQDMDIFTARLNYRINGPVISKY